MKNKRSTIIVIIFLISLLSVSVYNIYAHTSNFFEFSSGNLFAIGVAIIFAYWFTQNKQKSQRFFDSIVKILESMQDTIDEEFIIDNFDEQKINNLQQSMRVIRNKIDGLKKIQNKLEISAELEYIEQQYNNYKALISNHMSDFQYLNKSKTDLMNYKNLLDSKITHTIIKIYSFDL